NAPAGKIFTKTWKLKNTGTCPWAGFTINYASGERMNAPDSVPVPETAAGGTVDLSVDLTAPTGDGTYTTYFSLQSATGESIAIGAEKTFYAKVIVGLGDAPAFTQSSSTSPGSPAVSIGDIKIYCRYNYSENAGYVQELASLINQARRDTGLSALNLNPLLTQAAQGHSIDMACNNFLGHEGSDGSRFGILVYAIGYPGSSQEIIAIGTPQNAMDQWYADIGHWEIVLNTLATEMGIGYAYNANSNFGGYFTVDIH
ncbi:MAG TPA: NBR1-Ig-like domain-containing protein, partial [Anaerolineales bacterium]|nr:NBR1-Ig-like domain-containing protein [Anaerolineales bacterium]